MEHLMTISEIRARYKKKEDPFDLTIEKWVRIRHFLDTASTLSNFEELSQAANIAVPFCFEYQIEDCLGCPLVKICGRGKGEKLLKVIRLIQIHVLAILAGNMLPKEPLTSEVDGLLMELKLLKAKPEGKDPPSL
jgi:hypothetical protein